jgi:adenylate kinase
MRVYEEQTAPVAGHYETRGLLTRVLGEGTIEEVLERIKGALQQGDHG